jgi:hypothetical protein
MLKQVQHDVCLKLQHTRHSNAAKASLDQRNCSLNGAAYSQYAGIKQDRICGGFQRRIRAADIAFIARFDIGQYGIKGRINTMRLHLCMPPHGAHLAAGGYI